MEIFLFITYILEKFINIFWLQFDCLFNITLNSIAFYMTDVFHYIMTHYRLIFSFAHAVGLSVCAATTKKENYKHCNNDLNNIFVLKNIYEHKFMGHIFQKSKNGCS